MFFFFCLRFCKRWPECHEISLLRFFEKTKLALNEEPLERFFFLGGGYFCIRTCAAAHDQAAVVFLYQDHCLLQLALRSIPPRGVRAHGSQEASFAAAKSSR